jgi:serine/threonine-protein kinase
VAHAVGAALTGDERALIEAIPTENLAAYEAYLLGRYHLERRDDPVEAFSEAQRYFQIAIRQDPDLALAHSALAGAYAQLAMWGHSDPRELWPLVEQWSRSAQAIDSTFGFLGTEAKRFFLFWDWDTHDRNYLSTIESRPSDPLLRWLYSEHLMAQGRVEEGLREGSIAETLDPLSSYTLSGQTRLAFRSRRYHEADQLLEVLLARHPDNYTAARYLALSFIYGGQPERASQLVLDPRAGQEPSTRGGRAGLARYLALLGEADSAKVLIDQAVSGPSDEYLPPEPVWETYAVLGDIDEAFRWMERTIEVQAWGAGSLGITPLADPLRDDPRYQAILDRIGLGHLKSRFDSLAAADARGGS